MIATLSLLAGGIGLFLLGMVLMSDSLKAMAGESLRAGLAKLTGKPIKAMLAGLGATAAVQSSTATTMATIGFVSAGLLSFQNSIGVIIGANIGSTSTGWIVALLGMKFSIASLAMPVIAVGAIMKLLGKDRMALIGLTLAGFGLIFVGIDFLQQAMSGLASKVDLTQYASTGIGARLLLILIGIVMTIILQASSAALATTLAALSTGTIDFSQAMSLVIGQNIGTTATALLAAMGGTASAKRTALVHFLFNVGSAILAFFILQPIFSWGVQAWGLRHDGVNTALALAVFHTAFSLLGAMVFLPQSALLARLATRLVPEHAPPGLRQLDNSLLSVPALAIAAAEKTICLGLSDTCRLLAKRLQGEPLSNNQSGINLDKLLKAVDAYLAKLPAPQSVAEQQRLMHLLLLLDQTHVLRDDLVGLNHANTIHQHPALWDLAQRLPATLEHTADWLLGEGAEINEAATEELRQITGWVHERQPQARRSVVEGAVNELISPAEALDQLTAQRWLERLSKHITRITETLGEMRTTFKA